MNSRMRYIILSGACLILLFHSNCSSARYMNRGSANHSVSGSRHSFYFSKRRSQPTDVMIRVLLGRGRKTEIVATGGWAIKDLKKGRVLARGQKQIDFGLLRKVRKGRPLLLDFERGYFALNGKRYRGQLALHASRNSMLLVNHLVLDEYLYGVVGAEMSPSWHLEALKAQAVCARTYALQRMSKAKKSLFDVDDSTASQVYKGINGESARVRRAVDGTTGIVMLKHSKLVGAWFYSSCGGKTEMARFVWGSTDDSTHTTKCEHCRGSRTYKWKNIISNKVLSRYTKRLGIGSFRYMKVLTRSPSGRAVRIGLKGSSGKKVVKGNAFRLGLGAQLIKSLRFKSRAKGSGLYMVGRGWGHGVGMCQYGARAMAKRSSYRNILNFYFKDVALSPLTRSREWAVIQKNHENNRSI